MAERAIRAHALDHLLKWDILMRISAQGNGPDLAQQFAECRAGLQGRAHNQRVGKQADQPFDFSVVAVSDRHAYKNDLLSAVSVQQNVEGSQQAHKQRSALVATDLPQ